MKTPDLAFALVVAVLGAIAKLGMTESEVEEARNLALSVISLESISPDEASRIMARLEVLLAAAFDKEKP